MVTSAAGIDAIPRRFAKRRVQALFGEINIPVFKDTFIHELTVNVAGRYDKYSDVGDTFNPKFAVTLAPVEWLTFRGNAGKSFQAPSLGADPTIVLNNLNLVGPRFLDPLRPANNSAASLYAVNGVVAPLKPQKATTKSVGFDLRPPFVENLSLGLTWWNVKFKDQVANVPIQNIVYNEFPDLLIVNPAAITNPASTLSFADFSARATEFANIAPLTDAVRADFLNRLATNPSSIYGICDCRIRNLAVTEVKGLDFYLRYRTPMDFGAIFFNTGGSYLLDFVSKATPASLPAATNSEENQTQLRVATSSRGDRQIHGQVTHNYNDGFRLGIPLNVAASNYTQTNVKGFHTVDLFFRYDVEGDGWLSDLQFTLNVDNVLDEDPPRINEYHQLRRLHQRLQHWAASSGLGSARSSDRLAPR